MVRFGRDPVPDIGPRFAAIYGALSLVLNMLKIK
jgi:hypothetical protein